MINDLNQGETAPSSFDNFEDALQSALSEASRVGKNIRSIHIVKKMEYQVENNLITSHAINTKFFLKWEAAPVYQPIHQKEEVYTHDLILTT